jgi:hypothetical protein
LSLRWLLLVRAHSQPSVTVKFQELVRSLSHRRELDVLVRVPYVLLRCVVVTSLTVLSLVTMTRELLRR